MRPSPVLSKSLKSYLPKKYTFKGLPIEFRSTDCDKIIDTLLKYGELKELLKKGHQVSSRYGVRCKIFPYPEERLAVWVMIGCMYLEEEN